MRALPPVVRCLLSSLLFATLPGTASAATLEPKCLVEGGWSWIELAYKPGCHVWAWEEKSALGWSGGCMGDLAGGEGVLSWNDGGVMEGPFVDGRQHADGPFAPSTEELGKALSSLPKGRAGGSNAPLRACTPSAKRWA